MSQNNLQNETIRMSAKERIRGSYGENQPVVGAYDPALAAKCRNGTFVGRADGDVTVFRGIPFAKPPVDSLRWKRPESVDDADGVFEAYYNGKTPIQTEWLTEQASYYPQGEDCLYLNVWKNPSCDQSDKPVMVFLHGGAYGWGGTADPMYDGKNFVTANPDIVLVTAAYRTGLMGFVDLSYLDGGEDYPDAPNLGLLDQIEALRWVQKNIRAFGGDPENVTVFGESAGGGSVSLLPMIDGAKGLFKRVIAESGSVALTFSKEECKDFTRRLVKEAKTKLMDDLMALTEEQLKEINEKLNYYNNFPMRDGRIIPLDPYEPYVKGVTADVEMLMGTNANEMNYWIGEVGGIVPYRFSVPVKFENDMRLLSDSDKARAKKFLSLSRRHKMWQQTEFYNELMFRLPMICQAENHSKNGGKVYLYYWTQPSAVSMRGACHAVELAYVFGNLDETIYTGKRADEALSKLVMTMWTNFARTGDPSCGELTWEPYSADHRATMVLGKNAELRNDILAEQRKLLYPLLRYMINPSYATLDYNVPFVRKAAGAAALGLTAAVALGVSVFRLFRKK
ncbi:MAG: carboxylesterase/lipase family protein [Ruminococcus sp.]|nr:carboxylesterase/lipase family protein [Ruminococcus sp.]